jgi:hypothetical protein
VENELLMKLFSLKNSLPGMRNRMKNEENNKNKQCIIMPLRE